MEGQEEGKRTEESTSLRKKGRAKERKRKEEDGRKGQRDTADRR